MHWSGEQQRLSGEQIALHKSQLRRLGDVELQRSYGLYLRALRLHQGPLPRVSRPPSLPYRQLSPFDVDDRRLRNGFTNL
jgi:hypothetical protein